MTRVFNFSGGKTSALMTIRGYQPGDIVLFTDTKMEHPKTYKFINDFEAHEGIPVQRAVYTNKNFPGLEGFEALISYKKYLPNREQRFCTEELKINTAKRYLRNLGIRKFENFIGFRADEERRVKAYTPKFKNVHTSFPLYEQGVNKAMVNEYWSKKSYTLEIPAILGNCTLCFLKGQNNIINILKQYPELAQEWISLENMEKNHLNHKTGGRYDATFIKGVKYETLLSWAKMNQSLFDLDIAEPAFNCSCTV